MCSSFSGIGADFGIEFTIHLVSDNSQVNSVIYLSTAVYGKIVITDPSGIPQSLDIHFREVTADDDNSPGGEFPLVQYG